MNRLSEDMKREAVKDLKAYFGRPPYDVEYIRRSSGSSGLFDQQALAKYGRTPSELIRELRAVFMTEKTKPEAFRDLKIYLGEPPITKETLRDRLASGLCEMQVQAKYFMTVDDLMKEVGFEVVECGEEIERLQSGKKEENLKNYRTHSGEPPGVTDKIEVVPSPGSPGMRILFRYSMTMDTLMTAVEIACI